MDQEASEPISKSHRRYVANQLIRLEYAGRFFRLHFCSSYTSLPTSAAASDAWGSNRNHSRGATCVREAPSVASEFLIVFSPLHS